jgi:hypothetical protein
MAKERNSGSGAVNRARRTQAWVVLPIGRIQFCAQMQMSSAKRGTEMNAKVTENVAVISGAWA